MLAYHQTLIPDSLSGPALDKLLALGWYRMHQTIFTTTHLVRDEFYRVHWLRYPLHAIRDLAYHRRIRRRTNAFRFEIEAIPGIPDAYEELYARYRRSVDFDGPITIQQSLFGDDGIDRRVYDTKCISVFDQDR